MLHIQIITIGKLKEKFWTQACEEYLRRLRPFANVELVELPDVDPAKAGGDAKAIEQESASIERHLQTLPPQAIKILMDINGILITSEDMERLFVNAPLEASNDIAFIVGGSCGVTKELANLCDKRWSFGRITLPHNLARVVLLEQIYRGFKILRNEPYHK